MNSQDDEVPANFSLQPGLGKSQLVELVRLIAKHAANQDLFETYGGKQREDQEPDEGQ